MRFCQFCGREIPEGQSICDCRKEAISSFYKTSDNTDSENLEYTTKNGKIFSVLAYLGFLFFIGLLVTPEKDTRKLNSM